MALADLIPDIQIEDIIAQMGPEQIFGGHVGHRFCIPVLMVLGRGDESRQQAVADGVGQCSVVVEGSRVVESSAGNKNRLSTNDRLMASSERAVRVCRDLSAMSDIFLPPKQPCPVC